MTTLETERLLLRPYEPQDEAAYLRLVQDAEVMRHLPGGQPLTTEQARAAFQRRLSGADPQRRHFAIVEKASGEVVGWVGLMPLEDSQEVEVYYGLARAAWGQGYATEAARRVVRWGFEEIGLPRIVAVADPGNARSLAVLARLGLAYRGTETHYGRPLATYQTGAPAPAPAPPPASPSLPPPPAASPASAFCASCGAPLPPGAAFCTQCGTAARAPAWALAPPVAAPSAPTTRPGGVTFACVLSIVLGAIGCVSAFALLTYASFAGSLPYPGPPTAELGALAALALAAFGVMGIVAGTQGLRGVAWTRWAMVALFGVGAAFAITTLVIPALNVLAIVFLVQRDAVRWFEAQQRGGGA
jgi:RimJ/RimL family protein N-acetyltransferase